MRCCWPLVSILLAAGSCTTARTTTTAGASRIEREVSSTGRDTLWITDSVRVVERGDTVRVASVRTLYRTRTLRDTVRITSADTVRMVREEASPAGSRRDAIPWPWLLAGVGALAGWLIRGNRRA